MCARLFVFGCTSSYSPPAALHSNPPIHALGIATYVCDGSFTAAAVSTPAQLVAQCNASLPTSRALFVRYRDIAAAKGLGIVTYEVGRDAAIVDTTSPALIVCVCGCMARSA